MDSKKVFQPTLIILQILALQCFYYLAMGSIWIIPHILFEHSLSLGRLFSDQYVDFSSWSGWVDTICTFTSGIVGAYLLSIIVERAKRCVDFTFTVYFVHIVSCTCYSGFPLEWEWWLMQILSSVLMATLGEYWCSIQELKDIPVYTRASSSTAIASAGRSGGGAAAIAVGTEML
jgi:protein SYS1